MASLYRVDTAHQGWDSRWAKSGSPKHLVYPTPGTAELDRPKNGGRKEFCVRDEVARPSWPRFFTGWKPVPPFDTEFATTSKNDFRMPVVPQWVVTNKTGTRGEH